MMAVDVTRLKNHPESYVWLKGSPSSVDDSTTSHKRNVRKAASRLAEVVDAHRPLLQPRQFPRDNLTLGVMLGEGEYGPIYRGEAHGLGLNNESIPVVVKVLSINEEVISHTLFKQDVEMLSSINHLNVVELLAVCTHESPQYILLDAGQPGDLLTHIREKKNSLPHCSAITMEFLRIADEICIGMGYLVSERFIHKDLALRNCSIGFDAVVKISHLGIGPLAYPEAYFRVNETDLPIRWMSPEAITNASFTSMSDVWSFGVTLWELFTYGELPFSDRSNEEVLEYLLGEEGRLHKPIVCSDHIFDLILSCWTNDPHSRPFFLDIHESLTELSQILSSLSVLDLGTPDSSSST